MDGCLSPKETVEKYIAGCDAKVNMSAYKLLIKAVMAGAMLIKNLVASIKAKKASKKVSKTK